MTDWRERTIETYNQSAAELAEYFQGIGPRTNDIEKGLELIGNPENPVILEIGCGDGRDAAEIAQHTTNFRAFDVSTAFIDLAQARVPGASFEVADAVSYDYGAGIDLVFAFASLLHLDNTEVKTVLSKVHEALKDNGVFYISLKYSADYRQDVKQDQYGERLFYYYSPEIIEELAGNAFQSVFSDRQTIGNTEWFTIALQKRTQA